MSTPSNVIMIADMVLAELQVAVPAITASAGVGGGAAHTVQQVEQILDDLRQAVAGLQTAEGQNSGLALVERISQDAQAVLAVAASLPLPGPAAIAIRAAQMAVPFLVGLAQVVWPKKVVAPAHA